MDGMSRDMGTIQTEAEYRRLFDEAMERQMGKGKRPLPMQGSHGGMDFARLLALMQSGGMR